MTSEKPPSVLRLEAKLEKQWAWLQNPENRNHEDYGRRDDIFLRTLRKYEDACQKEGWTQ